MNLNSHVSENKFNRGRGHAGTHAASSASDTIEDILESVKGYADTATEFVKKRPVTVLLGAVAIGAAVALASSSMRSSKKWSSEHARE